jgi:hypothetical protein
MMKHRGVRNSSVYEVSWYHEFESDDNQTPWPSTVITANGNDG